jgi:hypothetical protein
VEYVGNFGLSIFMNARKIAYARLKKVTRKFTGAFEF